MYTSLYSDVNMLTLKATQMECAKFLCPNITVVNPPSTPNCLNAITEITFQRPAVRHWLNI